MTHQQTPAEHAQQKAWVIAAELLAPTRAQRHGVYARRPPVVVVVAAHHYVLPVVRENLL